MNRRVSQAVGAGAGLVLMLGLGVVGLIGPARSTLASLAHDIEHLERELSRPVDGPGVVEGLTAEVEALRGRRAQRDMDVPSESDIAGFVRTISATLGDLGLDRNEMTTGAPEARDDARSIPLSLQIEGEFPEIHRAIERIEALPRLVRVRRLTIESLAKQRELGADAGVQASVLLDVFYEPEEGAGAP